MIEAIELGDWGSLGAEAAPGASTMPDTRTPTVPVSLAPAGIFTPPECASVRELAFGTSWSRSSFALPSGDSPLGTVAVVAARIPTSTPRATALAIGDRVLSVLKGTRYFYRSHYTENDYTPKWTFERRGYIQALGIVYVTFKCFQRECSSIGVAHAQAALTNAVRDQAGVAVLPLGAKARSLNQVDQELAAIMAVNAVEDFRAMMTEAFGSSVDWGLRLDLRRFSGSVSTMALAQGKITGADAFANAILAEARSIATRDDKVAADTAISALDPRLIEELRVIDVAAGMATQNLTAEADAFTARLPDLIRSYVQSRINTLTGFDDSRKLWISCRWWAEADTRYPMLVAQVNAQKSQIAVLQSWFRANGPAIQAARDRINTARSELLRIRESLNLSWYEKKYGPFTPIGWGITIGGLGLGYKLLKIARSGI